MSSHTDIADRHAVVPGQRSASAAPTTETDREITPPVAGRQVRAHRTVMRVVLGLDALVLVASVGLGWPLRALAPGLAPATTGGLVWALWLSPVIVLGWICALAFSRAYARQLMGSGFEEFQAVARGSFIGWFGASTLLYLTNIPLSRGFLLSVFVIGLPVLLVERLAVRKWLDKNRRRGDLRHRALLVGDVLALEELSRVLDRQVSLGYDVVGYVDSAKSAGANPLLSHWIPDGLDNLRQTCDTHGIDTVMLVGGGFDLRNVTWELEGSGVDVVVVPHLADVAAPRMFMRPVAGLPLLYVEEPGAARARSWHKRAFDIAVAGTATLILSPLMLAAAIAIKLNDRGPVLFRQPRVGLNGDTFYCLKFRSMRTDAPALEAALREESGHEGALFKLERDPRITRVGGFMRRFSIDELPQLFNVLNGTMSLVGPRPQQQWEVDTYSDMARRRLHVRPGMTGLWQVSGRSRLSFDESIRLDLYYRDNWSMLVDLAIIGRTVKAVVGSDGAY
jgi:exopolysaccharide biosynthesis polyprenyl glycosylphosphotransferase